MAIRLCSGVTLHWHTNAAAGVRRAAVLERVDVRLDLLELDFVGFRALREQC